MRKRTDPTNLSAEVGTTKHTPGPWRVGPPPDGHCRIYSPTHTHAIARTYGPDLNGIGICALTGPENAADAILIAAAPDMLEALRFTAANIRLLGSANALCDPPWPYKACLAKMEAAIARAEGRTSKSRSRRTR